MGRTQARARAHTHTRARTRAHVHTYTLQVSLVIDLTKSTRYYDFVGELPRDRTQPGPGGYHASNIFYVKVQLPACMRRVLHVLGSCCAAWGPGLPQS